MLISFHHLVNHYSIKPTGVLHIGGSHAEEAESYNNCGVYNQIWIEAIPEIFNKLHQNIINNQFAIAFNACIAEVTGNEVVFNITNNAGQSSSLFDLKEHIHYHPDVYVTEKLHLKTITIDDLMGKHQIDLKNYDFLNMDIQGAELLALHGMIKNLDKINYIYTEVNEKELYEGCAMVDELDSFLSDHGFEAKEVKMTNCGWGDKFYMRKK